MKYKECKTIPQDINVNGDEPVFFPFSIETSKCGRSCNNINYPHPENRVPDIMKHLDLISRTNETGFIECH